METSLERAWQEWEAFCVDTLRRVQEAVASGLAPAAWENEALRTALAALDASALATFLDDPRLEETYPESVTGLQATSRFGLLLCLLPPHAALTLAQRYDDPCRAKSNLPPRARLTLFLTLRWKAFLIESLRRDYAVLALQGYRFHLRHFVEKYGDESAKALLKSDDSPALARELAKAQKQLPTRPTQP